MSLRFAPRSRGLLAAILCVIVTLSSCRNVEEIKYGAEYSSDGVRLQMTSLPPRCGCITLTNITTEPMWIESWFYNVRRGQMVLESEDTRRVLFDWAGTENTDAYELVAWPAEGSPRRKKAKADGTPVDGYSLSRGNAILWERPPIVSVRCTDTACDFGPLSMDRMYNATVGQDQITTRQRGVNLTTVLEVASARDTCGCLMLRNITKDNTVTLTSTVHGKTTGQVTVPQDSDVFIAFDWAGSHESDVYVVEATSVANAKAGAEGGALQSPTSIANIPADALSGATTPGGKVRGDPAQSGRFASAGGGDVAPPPKLSIRLRDYISVVGQLVDMRCTEFGPLFLPAAGGTLPAGDPGGAPAPKAGADAAGPPAPAAAPLSAAAGPIFCSWGGGLGMYSAYAEDHPVKTEGRPPDLIAFIKSSLRSLQ